MDLTTLPKNGGDDLAAMSQQPEIVIGALQQITAGEVEQQISVARRYPRSLRQFMQSAQSMATLDQETAAECFYAMKRGGKTIEGPSARLAEIVASAWGNIRVESRVVETTEKFVTAQATAWDIERNVLMRSEVRRRITDKRGKTYSDDMVIVTGNAAASIAMRNAVFKVVPAAYVRQVYNAARECAIGNARTLADRRSAALGWFAKAGCEEARVLAALGVPSVEDLGIDELGTLQGMRTAITQDGADLETVIPAIKSAKSDGTKSFGRKKSAKAQPAKAEEPAHDGKTGEVVDNENAL